jgi:hypothetical protein
VAPVPKLLWRSISFPILNYQKIQWSEYYLKLNFMNCENRTNVFVFTPLYVLMMGAVAACGYMLCFMFFYAMAFLAIRLPGTRMSGFQLESELFFQLPRFLTVCQYLMLLLMPALY